MEASLQMLWFVASLTLLVASAKWFVKGAETLGYRLGMTPFTIGATIVGIGTSFGVAGKSCRDSRFSSRTTWTTCGVGS